MDPCGNDTPHAAVCTCRAAQRLHQPASSFDAYRSTRERLAPPTPHRPRAHTLIVPPAVANCTLAAERGGGLDCRRAGCHVDHELPIYNIVVGPNARVQFAGSALQCIVYARADDTAVPSKVDCFIDGGRKGQIDAYYASLDVNSIDITRDQFS